VNSEIVNFSKGENKTMKRLYNEYSACPSYEGPAKEIDDIIVKAFRDVWNVVKKDDLCPIDTSHYCDETLSVLFSQEILRTAMNKRRKERNTQQVNNKE
jgi:hypothetical protein